MSLSAPCWRLACGIFFACLFSRRGHGESQAHREASRAGRDGRLAIDSRRTLERVFTYRRSQDILPRIIPFPNSSFWRNTAKEPALSKEHGYRQILRSTQRHDFLCHEHRSFRDDRICEILSRGVIYPLDHGDILGGREQDDCCTFSQRLGSYSGRVQG